MKIESATSAPSLDIDLYALEDVRAALRSDEVFVSGKRVAANPLTNLLGRGTTLFSDGEVHQKRRRVLMGSLGAKAPQGIRPRVEARAEELIDRLLSLGRAAAAEPPDPTGAGRAGQLGGGGAGRRGGQRALGPGSAGAGDRPRRVGWGNGPHTCVGIHLTKLEMAALPAFLNAR